jgi:sugar-specific transcriptional regulator TrmB
MSETEVLSSLNEIGFTQYEAKVYSTLVSEGVSPAKDISNICGIPYGKIYEIITTLTNKGFVEMLPTKPMKYKAIDPDRLIKTIKQQSTEKLELAEKIIKKELGKTFDKNKKFLEMENSFWMLNGRMAINKKMEELFEKAQDHVYILTSESGLNRIKYYSEVLRKLQAKGVNVVICSKLTEKNSECVKCIKPCSVHNVNSVDHHFISIDGEKSILFEPLPDDEHLRYGRDAGIFAHNTSFTQFVEQFFEMKVLASEEA